MTFVCTGCYHSIDYASSAVCQDITRHSVVSVIMRLGAFLAGIGFANYQKLVQKVLRYGNCEQQKLYTSN